MSRPGPHDDAYAYIRRLVKERSGLALTEDKTYLIDTRMRPILTAHDLKDVSALVTRLRGGREEALRKDVVEAMTTNESLFFRDYTPFEALEKQMLPELTVARPAGKPIRIWSAAASTGQEAYSIAIVLEEQAAKLRKHPVDIVATDLSRAALRRAELGMYSAFEVGRGMPPQLLARYFRPSGRNHHTVTPELRKRIRFEYRNLLDPFDKMGKFDIVFCRNVLIYFDRDTKRDLLERMARIIPPDGYLVLGAPETPIGLTDCFGRDPQWRNVYRRRNVEDLPGEARHRLCA